MPEENIRIEIKDNVASMSLARVDALNALSIEFAREIAASVTELINNNDVRAIVLDSAARIFCAGLDLKAIAAGGMGNDLKSRINLYDRFFPLFECCDVMERCNKPIIAAVHGKCVGGGLDIISACDIRMCTGDASFSLREVAIGIVADMGVLQRLPHIIGQGNTREMAYTAKFFSAGEVERMGLVKQVYPDKETMMKEAMKLAHEIAEMPPVAVQQTKETLNFSRNVSIKEGMAHALQKNMVLLYSEDTREAMTAFMEKRKPVFKGE